MALFKKIHKEKLKGNICNTDKMFHDIETTEAKITKEDRQGKSIELTFRDVNTKEKYRGFLKLWPDTPEQAQTKALQYELYMYMYITNHIIAKGQSCNFIPLLVQGKCDKKEMEGGLKLKTKMTFSVRHAPTTLHGFLTGSSDTMVSLDTFFHQTTVALDEFASIVFQIFHAVYVMVKHGINHNDIHSGNMLVDKLKKPICLEYEANKKKIKFLTKYIVKIFDWDLSNSSAKVNPSFLEKEIEFANQRNKYFPAEHGANNIFHPKRDLYTVICALHQVLKYQNRGNKPVQTFFQKLTGLTHEELQNMLYSDADNQVRVGVSQKTAEKFNDIQPVDKKVRENYYFLPIKEIEKLLTTAEMKDLRTRYPRIKIVEKLYFCLEEDRRAKKFRIRIPNGFQCHFLHEPKESFLPDIQSYFTEEKKWKTLTSPLLLDLSTKADQSSSII
jgi:hypothetical protein